VAEKERRKRDGETYKGHRAQIERKEKYGKGRKETVKKTVAKGRGDGS